MSKGSKWVPEHPEPWAMDQRLDSVLEAVDSRETRGASVGVWETQSHHDPGFTRQVQALNQILAHGFVRSSSLSPEPLAAPPVIPNIPSGAPWHTASPTLPLRVT